jgi:hypothetical protein
MDLDVLAYAAPGAFALLVIWYWSRPRPLCLRASMQQAQERRREELLQQLTFFFSSLRHIYNKYPRTASLPPSVPNAKPSWRQTSATSRPCPPYPCKTWRTSSRPCTANAPPASGAKGSPASNDAWMRPP